MWGKFRGGGEGREREVALRVEEIMATMWYVNQTYTAVTREGNASTPLTNFPVTSEFMIQVSSDLFGT